MGIMRMIYIFNEVNYGMIDNKKAFNIIGVSLIAILTLIVALQFVCGFISDILSEGILFQIVTSAGVNIGTFIIVVPIVALMLRKLPAEEPKPHKSIKLIDIVFFAIIGLGIICFTDLLQISVSGFQQSVIMQPREFSVIMLISCIIAAVAEELLFRKIILSHLKPFGNKEAVFVSALAFGLCHINFWSFLFAFALGLLWGQITVHTNTISYSCVLHTTSNILVVSLLPFVFGKIPENAINAICASLILLGAIVFFAKRKFILSLNGTNKGVGIKTILKCPGMISFLVISVGAVLLLFVSQL